MTQKIKLVWPKGHHSDRLFSAHFLLVEIQAGAPNNSSLLKLAFHLSLGLSPLAFLLVHLRRGARKALGAPRLNQDGEPPMVNNTLLLLYLQSQTLDCNASFEQFYYWNLQTPPTSDDKVLQALQYTKLAKIVRIMTIFCYTMAMQSLGRLFCGYGIGLSKRP